MSTILILNALSTMIAGIGIGVHLIRRHRISPGRPVVQTIDGATRQV